MLGGEFLYSKLPELPAIVVFVFRILLASGKVRPQLPLRALLMQNLRS